MEENSVKLGQRVKYIRVQPGVNGEPDALVHGEGNIVSKLIGINGRLNFMVKDGGKAYTLEPMAINPTPQAEIEYWTHSQRVNDRVLEHKKDAMAEVNRVNAILDNWDENIHGPKIDIELGDQPANDEKPEPGEVIN